MAIQGTPKRVNKMDRIRKVLNVTWFSILVTAVGVILTVAGFLLVCYTEMHPILAVLISLIGVACVMVGSTNFVNVFPKDDFVILKKGCVTGELTLSNFVELAEKFNRSKSPVTDKHIMANVRHRPYQLNESVAVGPHDTIGLQYFYKKNYQLDRIKIIIE